MSWLMQNWIVVLILFTFVFALAFTIYLIYEAKPCDHKNAKKLYCPKCKGWKE